MSQTPRQSKTMPTGKGAPMPTILESRRESAAKRVQDLVNETETFMARDDFDAEDSDFVALREKTEKETEGLSELIALIDARRLAATRPVTTPSGELLSPMRQVLREYDRGNSPRFAIPYELQRELQTGDPYFTPNPSRIQVATLPVITPSLDVVRTVQTGDKYDFTVPPPPEPATSVPEGGQKRTVDWVATKVSGDLDMDASIIDVTRQTLEDDASAERTLRAWLVDGVRLAQDAKCQAAIAGATGTQTASGASVAAAVRNGKAELSGLGVVATAAYLNPADAAELDLSVSVTQANGINGASTAWGMRIVESPAIAVGAPIVGSMGQAVYLLYRSSISTYLTDSGMTQETTPRDRFSHNLIGILGEGRSKAHVVAPQLLCKCTVTAGAVVAAKK